MRITSKGQVTIPQEIREKAGLRPHTEVEFEYVRGRVIIRPVDSGEAGGRKAIAPLKGCLRAVRMSTDELMALTRGED